MGLVLDVLGSARRPFFYVLAQSKKGKRKGTPRGARGKSSRMRSAERIKKSRRQHSPKESPDKTSTRVVQRHA